MFGYNEAVPRPGGSTDFKSVLHVFAILTTTMNLLMGSIDGDVSEEDVAAAWNAMTDVQRDETRHALHIVSFLNLALIVIDNEADAAFKAALKILEDKLNDGGTPEGDKK